MDGSITGSIESDDNLDDFPRIDPYEKKYYALLRRCDAIQQSNERLVNRIQHVTRLIRSGQRERCFIAARLDKYKDDYHTAFELNMRKIAIKQEMIEEAYNLPVSVSLPISQPKKSKGGCQVSNNFHATEEKGEGQAKAPIKRKVKHEKTERDPNAPKRPANPFLLFCQENRSSVLEQMQKESNEDVSHQLLTKELAQNWNGLASDDKKVYYEKYDKEKVRYEKEMQIYSSATNNVGAALSSTSTITVPTVSTVKIKTCPPQNTSTLSIPSVKIKPPHSSNVTIPSVPKPKISPATGNDVLPDNANTNFRVESTSSNQT